MIRRTTLIVTHRLVASSLLLMKCWHASASPPSLVLVVLVRHRTLIGGEKVLPTRHGMAGVIPVPVEGWWQVWRHAMAVIAIVSRK